MASEIIFSERTIGPKFKNPFWSVPKVFLYYCDIFRWVSEKTKVSPFSPHWFLGFNLIKCPINDLWSIWSLIINLWSSHGHRNVAGTNVVPAALWANSRWTEAADTIATVAVTRITTVMKITEDKVILIRWSLINYILNHLPHSNVAWFLIYHNAIHIYINIR